MNTSNRPSYLIRVVTLTRSLFAVMCGWFSRVGRGLIVIFRRLLERSRALPAASDATVPFRRTNPLINTSLRLKKVSREHPAWVFATITGSLGIILLLMLQFASLPSALSATESAKTLKTIPDATMSEEKPADAPIRIVEETRLDANPITSGENIAAVDVPELDPFAVDATPDADIDVNPKPHPFPEPTLEEPVVTENPFTALPNLELEIQKFADNNEEFLVHSATLPSTATADIPLPKENDQWGAFARKRLKPPVMVGAYVTAHATTTVQSLRLKLELLSPPATDVGKLCPVRYRITNIGSTTATGILLSVDLPQELSHRKGRTLEYDVETLAPGAVHEAHLAPRAVKPGYTKSSAELILSGSVLVHVEKGLEIRPRTTTTLRKNVTAAVPACPCDWNSPYLR